MHVCIRDTFLQYIENMTYSQFMNDYWKQDLYASIGAMSGSIIIQALITEYDIKKDVVDPAWEANILAKCGPQIKNDMFM